MSELLQCPCGTPIERQPHDTPKDWQWKLDNGRCRRKCLRLYPATRERGKPTLPDSIPMSSFVGEGIVLRPQPKTLPWRSEPYKDFIRTFPCLNPKCRSGMQSEAHHEQAVGHGGKSTTTGDDRTLPLCPCCHIPIRHQYGRSIWRTWGLDPEKLILHFNELWMRQGGKLETAR